MGFLASASASEASEEREVDEAEWTGDSRGETVAEVTEEEGAESEVMVLLRAEPLGRAVVLAMLELEAVKAVVVVVVVVGGEIWWRVGLKMKGSCKNSCCNECNYSAGARAKGTTDEFGDTKSD